MFVFGASALFLSWITLMGWAIREAKWYSPGRKPDIDTLWVLTLSSSILWLIFIFVVAVYIIDIHKEVCDK